VGPKNFCPSWILIRTKQQIDWLIDWVIDWSISIGIWECSFLTIQPQIYISSLNHVKICSNFAHVTTMNDP
jgi:hypothetical protein